MNSFKIIKKDKNSKARLGVLKTAHGTIRTPTYVFVGTYGKIRHLAPVDIKKTKTQIIISNTFHLWTEALKKSSESKDKKLDTFLTKSFGLKIPTMTDSGGFQVLSLAFGDKNKVGKFMVGDVKPDESYKRSKIKITERGVYFNYLGKKLFLGPELSMKIQHKIGADILFAFDQITSPLDDHDYNKKAVEMTDRWAQRCLDAKNEIDKKHRHLLFGIVQGGLFKDLRIKSAKSIGSMPFDGFGIGGSYTKKQIAQVLKWIVPHLPEERPRHLLGVGKIEDIFEAIENGMDTFDCVIPTREARHGKLYTKKGPIDIRRGRFSIDKKIIEPGCGCFTCLKKTPRSKINHLIKSQKYEEKAQGQRFALIHNMWFFNKLLEDIRSSIARGRFKSFKKKFLGQYLSRPRG
jgi:queuine tRNA-ribosyltransferase